MAYTIRVTSEPEVDPVTLDEVKNYLRIDADADDDLLKELITAATKTVESWIRRALITQTRELVFDDFPPGGFGALTINRLWSYRFSRELDAIMLPYAAPIQSVDSIKYLDEDATEQTLSTSVYRVDDKSEPAFVVLAPNETWPETVESHGGVYISYTCGYGDEGKDVPQAIRQGIMRLVDKLYNHECAAEECMETDFILKAMLQTWKILVP